MAAVRNGMADITPTCMNTHSPAYHFRKKEVKHKTPDQHVLGELSSKCDIMMKALRTQRRCTFIRTAGSLK